MIPAPLLAAEMIKTADSQQMLASLSPELKMGLLGGGAGAGIGALGSLIGRDTGAGYAKNMLGYGALFGGLGGLGGHLMKQLPAGTLPGPLEALVPGRALATEKPRFNAPAIDARGLRQIFPELYPAPPVSSPERTHPRNIFERR